MPSSIPSSAPPLFPRVVALLLVAAAATLAAGQERPEGLYFDRVEVDIVNLEVFVTDRQGRPVVGLSREDFALLVDGQPTEIQNFYAAAAAVTAPPPGSPEPPREGAFEPAPVVPSDQIVTLVVLIDDRHARAGERKRVLERLAAQFDRGLPPSTRAMVATLDSRIVLRQPLTRDGGTVADVLLGLSREAGRGYGANLQLRSLIRQLDGVTSDTAPLTGAGPTSNEQATGNLGDLLFAIRSYEAQERKDLHESLEQVGRLISSLGGMAGHKSVVYVGQGLNVAPGRAVMTAFHRKFGMAIAGAPSESEIAGAAAETIPIFNRLAERSNANRVSFYSVSTAGVGTSDAMSGETSRFDGWTPEVDLMHRADMSSGLSVLAAETGGRSLFGSADYDLIADWIATDAEYLYSLGFAAPEGAAGASHRVEVRLPDREGLELRYRHRLVTASREQRAVERTLATLIYGDRSNPLEVVAEMGAAEPHEKGLVVLPVLVKIPFARMTLLPTGANHSGELSIHVASEDRQGRLSDVTTLAVPVRVPADQLEAALAGVAGYRMALVVRPGRQRIAIGVRDVLGEVVSTLLVEHDVERAGTRRGGRRGR